VVGPLTSQGRIAVLVVGLDRPVIEFGRFHLLERIGAGGMGEVFRAELRGPDGFSRTVAVKRMLPDLAAEPDAVSMFVHEARLAARLVHRNIVQVFDLGKVGESYFLVMEYVQGCDLSRLLAYLADNHRKLPLGVAVTIVAELLDGLAFAHELRGSDDSLLGLVHRDVAPSNVILGVGGEIKLGDFGIANTRERLSHTRAGAVRGRYHYMSPEQATGRAVDARSDLFAVGIILYRLVTDRRPFAGDTREEVLGHVCAGRFSPPDAINPAIGPELSAVLTTALRPEPAERFETAREFRRALLAAPIDERAPDAVELLRSLVAEATAAQVQTGSSEPDGVRESTEVLSLEQTLPVPSSSSPPPSPGSPPSRTEEPPAKPKTTVIIPTKYIVVSAIALVALGLAAVIALVTATPKRTTPVLRIALRMYPEQRDWMKEHVFEPFGAAEGVQVEIVEYNSTTDLSQMIATGEADVAKVDIEHASLLVELGQLQRIPPLAERVAPQAFHELRAALRPEALRLGTLRAVAGDDLYLLPRKLETAMLVYRPSLVRIAVAESPKHLAALDAKLKELIGRGLPDGFVLGPDPATWTSWDLVAAAWVWAHTPIAGAISPRYALRANHRVLMDAVGAGAPPNDPWHVSPALVDVMYEYAVMRELGVLHPYTDQPVDDHPHARDLLANKQLAAFVTVQIDIGILAGNGHSLRPLIDDPNDVDVAPLPRVIDLEHNAPVVPRSLTEVWGWGWGVPRNSREPELAIKLILAILSKANHAAELEEFPILSVRKDVTPTWALSRRINQVGDGQLGDRARFIDWPRRAGAAEELETRVENAFRDVILERHYRIGTKRIDRAEIEARLHRFLDDPQP
jgi:serine/threonine protein kinase/ABC-type glycerol-3-phosphate transport system substrate-binding protein